jgi:hypothetical protein
VRGFDEGAEVVHRAERGVDVAVIGDVVAVVAHRRGEERQEPDARGAEVLDVVELRREARKSPMPSSFASKNALTCTW